MYYLSRLQAYLTTASELRVLKTANLRMWPRDPYGSVSTDTLAVQKDGWAHLQPQNTRSYGWALILTIPNLGA